MKNLIILLMILSFPLKSQIVEFAPVGAKWSFFLEGSATEFETTQVISLKDTMINGITCKKMGTLSTHIFTTTVFEGTNFEYVYSDESAIYILIEDSFVKLVDFDSEVGDTITVVEDNFTGFFGEGIYEVGKFAYVVDSIVGDNNYQVLYSSPIDDSVWDLGAFSEHYGSRLNWHHPFGFETNVNIIGCCIGGLLCYDNGVEVFDFYENRECNGDLVGFESINISLEVFPNPSDYLVSFSFLSLQKNSKLYLYDSLGRQIVKKDIEKGETKKTIDVSNYTKGIYFWELEGSTGKLMVD